MINDISEMNRAIAETIKAPHSCEKVETGGRVYRSNLNYEIERVSNEGEKRLSLVRLLRESEGSGIIYVATAKEAKTVSDYLNQSGFAVVPYHEQFGLSARRRNLERFIAGELKALVVPNESRDSGAGEDEFVISAVPARPAEIDKPDVRFVIHYNMPMSLDAYYLESSGAGRDGRSARCALLFQIADRRSQVFFTSGRAPKAEEVTAVYAALERLRADKAPAALERIQAGAGDVAKIKVRSILSLLKNMGFLKESRGARYTLLKRDLGAHEIERLAREHTGRSKDALEKLERMTLYAQSSECRWKLLLEKAEAAREFRECGHCDNCRRPAARPSQAAGGATRPEFAESLHARHKQEEARIRPGDTVKLPAHGEVKVKAVEGDKIVVSLPGGEVRKFKREWIIR